MARLETTNPYHFPPGFNGPFLSKMHLFTLEWDDRDDGCFLELILDVSINILLRAYHSWWGVLKSQLLLTENIRRFLFQVCCTEGIIYIWTALSCDHEIYIFVIVSAGTGDASTVNELLLRNPLLVSLNSSPFLPGDSVQLPMFVWHALFPLHAKAVTSLHQIQGRTEASPPASLPVLRAEHWPGYSQRQRVSAPHSSSPHKLESRLWTFGAFLYFKSCRLCLSQNKENLATWDKLRVWCWQRKGETHASVRNMPVRNSAWIPESEAKVTKHQHDTEKRFWAPSIPVCMFAERKAQDR